MSAPSSSAGPAAVAAAAPSASDPTVDRQVLLKLTHALASLDAAKASIDAGRRELRRHDADDNIIDLLRLRARGQLLAMLQAVHEAKTRLARAGQPDRYYARQLRRVLRDGRSAMGSTHGDMENAGRNYPYVRWRLEEVTARLRGERD